MTPPPKASSNGHSHASSNGHVSSSSSADAAPTVDALTKKVARLEEELQLTRAMATQAVQRAEKAEAALKAAAAAGGGAAAAAAAASSASSSTSSSAGSSSAGSSQLATLRVTCKLHFGEHMLAVGSHPALGAWDVAGAAPLTWSDGDAWQAVVALPAEGRMEMKFVVRKADGSLVWQQGANLEVVLAPAAGGSRSLCFDGSYPSAFGGSGPFNVRHSTGECAADFSQDEAGAPAPAAPAAVTPAPAAEAAPVE